MHYGPAIERVLSIIERGVKDRLTVNGEILRLHSDMQSTWGRLKEQMNELDSVLDDIQADKKNQQLRDSISSMVSNDQSTLGSINGTPGSSPASSVVMSGISRELDPTTPKSSKLRSVSRSHLPQPGRCRNVSAPVGSGQLPRKDILSRSSVYGTPPGRDSPSLFRQSSATPTGSRANRPSMSASSDSKPRWNTSVIVQDTLTGHNFAPLSLTTPSPHAKKTPHNKPPLTHQTRPSISGIAGFPTRSPLSRDNTMTPQNEITPTRKTSASRLSYRDRIASPGPYSQQVLSQSSPSIRPRKLTTKSSLSTLSSSTRRISLQQSASDPTNLSPPSKPTRPASSLASNRRTSLLPTPPTAPARSTSSLAGNRRSSLLPTPPSAPLRSTSSLAGHRRSSLLPTPGGRRDSSVNGRESPQAIAGAAVAMKRGSSTTSTDSGRKAWR